jgi:hypothetical protein
MDNEMPARGGKRKNINPWNRSGRENNLSHLEVPPEIQQRQRKDQALAEQIKNRKTKPKVGESRDRKPIRLTANTMPRTTAQIFHAILNPYILLAIPPGCRATIYSSNIPGNIFNNLSQYFLYLFLATHSSAGVSPAERTEFSSHKSKLGRMIFVVPAGICTAGSLISPVQIQYDDKKKGICTS